MIKDLRDWKKESERKNRNKHQWGWFQHPNAGNVEYNIDFFNHVTGADGGDTSVLAGSVGDGGMGESLAMNDTVELYYDDIEVSGYYGPTDWETGYPEKEYNETVSWVYTVDRDDIFVDLEEFIAEESPELSDGQLEKIVSENFEELVDRYYQQLLDKYRSYAEEEANEKYEYDEYGHYLDAIGESVNIREALNKIDCNTCGKYDLLNMYDCSDMPVEKKAKLSEMLKENVSADKLYEYMNEESPWQVGLELFADNGKEYKVVSVLETTREDDYEIAVVSAIGNEASYADEEVYFVIVNTDVNYGPVDNAQDAIDWFEYITQEDDEDYEEEWPDADDDIDFTDLYGAHGEYDDDYGVQKRHSMKESISDDWSDTLETGGESSYCPDCGVRFVRDEEGNVVCPECKRTPHQIEMDKRKNESLKGKDDAFGESLDEDTIKQGKHWVNKGKAGTHGKFATKKEADAQRKAMFANGYKESIKKACRRGNAMNEGAMKEIDLEIQEAGGVDAYIDSLESQLRNISGEMRFLRGQARREMKAGGAYDSVDEINDALKATEREYNEVRKKYDYISSQQTGGVN